MAPTCGYYNSQFGQTMILFRFYAEVDIARVLQGSPWSFNNHLLVFHHLFPGEDPLQMPLCFVDFWVQVHHVLIGYYSEDLTRQFGNFHGTFLAFDSTNFTSGSHHSLRVRVKMDVRLPLRKKKCLVLSSQQRVYKQFQYERLPLFYFLCGKLGHSESFYPVLLTIDERGLSLGWGSSVHGPHLSHVSTSNFVQEVSNNLGLTLDKSQPKGILVGSTDVDDQCLDSTQTPSTSDAAGSATDRFPALRVFHARHSVFNHCPLVIIVAASLSGVVSRWRIHCFILGLVGFLSLLVKRRSERCGRQVDPSGDILAEIIKVKLTLNMEGNRKELFWGQWAWVNWLYY
ncbi:hypothetical protein Gotri_016168, partial [Gossypium trilobum]|nr:hypothetical protein [Gossypium trilobum]